jgi:putative peptidoglycan lipid II flippase
VFSSARVVVVFTLLTQLVGFIKTLLIAYYFGASADLDGYYLALVIPSLVVGVLGGVLQAGFMPVYMELLRDDQHQAGLLRNRIFTLLILILLPVCIILSFFSEHVVGLYVIKANHSVLDAAISAFKLVIFVMVLNAMADFLALTLNAHKQFILAITAPLGNMFVSSLFIIFWPMVSQSALTVGLISGVIFQIILVFWGLVRRGMIPRVVRLRIDDHICKVGSLASIMVIGILFANLNLVVDQVMAAQLGEGAVSLIGYANRFHNIIAQAMIMSVGVVLLPYLTELFLDKKNQIINELFIHLSSVLLLIGILVPILVLIFGDFLVGYLLKRGEFGDQEVTAVSSIWFWYSLGLAPMAWGIFLSKYFQAISHPHILAKVGVISFFANVILNLLLIRVFGIYGLAIGTSFVYCITAMVLHASFAHHARFSFYGVRLRLVITIIIGVIFIMACLIWPSVVGIRHPVSLTLAILVVLAMISVLKLSQDIKFLKNYNK